MTTYRAGSHHGVTIVSEDDGARCGRPDHDCARGHLVAVVVDGSVELAERICALLNGGTASGQGWALAKPYRIYSGWVNEHDRSSRSVWAAIQAAYAAGLAHQDAAPDRPSATESAQQPPVDGIGPPGGAETLSGGVVL